MKYYHRTIFITNNFHATTQDNIGDLVQSFALSRLAIKANCNNHLRFERAFSRSSSMDSSSLAHSNTNRRPYRCVECTSASKARRASARVKKSTKPNPRWPSAEEPIWNVNKSLNRFANQNFLSNNILNNRSKKIDESLMMPLYMKESVLGIHR